MTTALAWLSRLGHSISTLALLAFATAADVAQTAEATYPTRPIRWVIGLAPGGGADKTVRMLQKILQDNKWFESSAVVNKVGGGTHSLFPTSASNPAGTM